MKSENPERFSESIQYQQDLLDKYFAEYVGKAANDNEPAVAVQAA